MTLSTSSNGKPLVISMEGICETKMLDGQPIKTPKGHHLESPLLCFEK